MNWSEPHSLTAEEIARLASLPGAYVLGKRGVLGGIIWYYVGRADLFVDNRLRDHLPGAEENARLKAHGCDVFVVHYTLTADDAYQLECNTYHELAGEFGGLVNEIHPAAPPFSLARCACESPSPAPSLIPSPPGIPTPPVPSSVLRVQQWLGAPTPPSPPGIPTPKPLAPSISRRAEVVRQTANLMLRDLIGSPRPRFG